MTSCQTALAITGIVIWILATSVTTSVGLIWIAARTRRRRRLRTGASNRAEEQSVSIPAREPRAAAVCYDAQIDQFIVELTNGCTFAFPRGLGQGLEQATEEQLAAVTILGRGYGLHWEALDLDLSVAGIMAGQFGTRDQAA
jgi:hypothetical protein